MHRISCNNGKDFLEFREASGGNIEITDIAVNTDRRRGIGKNMVIELFRRLVPEKRQRLVFAITRQSNIIAQQFYLGIGFRQVGVLVHFYQDGAGGQEHASVYGKEVPVEDR